ALRAKRPLPVWHFDEFTADFIGKIKHTRNLIIREAGIHDLALIEDHLFKNSEAELHGAGADKLALHDGGIDRRARIADIHQFDDANASGFRIDLDFGARTAQHPERCDLSRLAGLMIRLFVRRYEGSDTDDIPGLHGEPRHHDVAKCHSRTGWSDDRAVP